MITIGGTPAPESFDDRVMHLACEFLWAVDVGMVRLDPSTPNAFQVAVWAAEYVEEWRRDEQEDAGPYGRLARLLIALDSGEPLDAEERASGVTKTGYTVAEARVRLRLHVLATVQWDENSVRQWIAEANEQLAAVGTDTHHDRVSAWWV